MDARNILTLPDLGDYGTESFYRFDSYLSSLCENGIQLERKFGRDEVSRSRLGGTR